MHVIITTEDGQTLDAVELLTELVREVMERADIEPPEEGANPPTTPVIGSDLPAVLTVPQTAEALGIGRTQAYELTRKYRATEGRSGIPCIRLGRLIRVPRQALEEWLAEPSPPTR